MTGSQSPSVRSARHSPYLLQPPSACHLASRSLRHSTCTPTVTVPVLRTLAAEVTALVLVHHNRRSTSLPSRESPTQALLLEPLGGQLGLAVTHQADPWLPISLALYRSQSSCCAEHCQADSPVAPRAAYCCCRALRLLPWPCGHGELSASTGAALAASPHILPVWKPRFWAASFNESCNSLCYKVYVRVARFF